MCDQFNIFPVELLQTEWSKHSSGEAKAHRPPHTPGDGFIVENQVFTSTEPNSSQQNLTSVNASTELN